MTTIIISKELASKINISFIPVKVEKGRKFKGKAYDLDQSYENSYGYSGSGVFPLTITYTSSLWDPINHERVHANSKFVETYEQDPDVTLTDKAEYIRTIIQNCIDWCSNQKDDEKQVLQYARNILLKKHPELKEAICEVIPDTRNIFEEVRRTLEWAMNLKTRPGMMYGRYCKGGNDLPMKKKINIALNALEKKGITKNKNFKAAWEINSVLFGISKK